MNRGLARVYSTLGVLKKNVRKHRACFDEAFCLEFDRQLRLLNDSLLLKKIEVEIHDEKQEECSVAQ